MTKLAFYFYKIIKILIVSNIKLQIIE